jgi:predicted DNA-binding antitoxin AbrB/MazE fold protein
MLETIEAIYENGIFKPLQPVHLPEGTHVQIQANPTARSLEAQIRQQLLANGSTPTEAERILDNLRLLWSSYDTLTDEQKTEVENARLDQQHFFDHTS